MFSIFKRKPSKEKTNTKLTTNELTEVKEVSTSDQEKIKQKFLETKNDTLNNNLKDLDVE